MQNRVLGRFHEVHKSRVCDSGRAIVLWSVVPTQDDLHAKFEKNRLLDFKISDPPNLRYRSIFTKIHAPTQFNFERRNIAEAQLIGPKTLHRRVLHIKSPEFAIKWGPQFLKVQFLHCREHDHFWPLLRYNTRICGLAQTGHAKFYRKCGPIQIVKESHFDVCRSCVHSFVTYQASKWDFRWFKVETVSFS